MLAILSILQALSVRNLSQTVEARFEAMKSLKRQNNLRLAAGVAFDFAVTTAVLRGAILPDLVSWNWTELSHLLPAGVAILVVSIVNAQLSADAKARLVFMKWTSPLPGSRAFSHYLTTDPRIDASTLKRKYGVLPTDPSDQNVLWYKLYRSVSNDGAVAEAHQQYLLTRDFAAVTPLLAVLLLPLIAAYTRSVTRFSFLFVFLAIQFLLAQRAARINAERLICTVLAINSAEAHTK
jgi:hypothetical protein